jgi:hypothetical protein
MTSETQIPVCKAEQKPNEFDVSKRRNIQIETKIANKVSTCTQNTRSGAANGAMLANISKRKDD